MHMVNPFHTVGQAAASLVQQHLDEEQASLMAGARIASGYLVAQGKSFDELKADAQVEIQVERARKEAQQRTKARLAAAEREGTQAALAEHSAKAQPAPANPDGAALTHGFDLDTVTRTQQEMLDDGNEVRKLAKESKMLNERYPVYRDHTALLHRTLPQAQPAPAAPQSVKKNSGDLLRVIIHEAVSECGTDSGKVFLKLREWANEKPPRQPLRGVAPDGIQWVDSNDKPAFLTRDALNKRLKRRR